MAVFQVKIQLQEDVFIYAKEDDKSFLVQWRDIYQGQSHKKSSNLLWD